MEIHLVRNKVAAENTYILESEAALLIIDPGSNKQEILDKIDSLAKPISAILLTHAHYDHIMSLDAVRERYKQPPVYISDKEADWLASPLDNLSGLSRHDDMEDVIMRPADFFFQYQTPYDLDGFQFQVLKTPGHSWGGVSFVFFEQEVAFSGDALFRETIGRTDLPTSDFDQLIDSIKHNLFTLPNHYRIFPGHGLDTTIGHEKNFNPFFKA
ncbi:MBL fold metallo-hydrolase [Streptococcus dentapri]|uniref:MBL fold metallo-hydrolase n=1 Tax=Streptococcus dentapri TaxID=573564 RepID=A0ABV8D2N5_9STRE